jgi:DNA end-binding protein Ku
VADKASEKAYRLLLDAMEEANKVAIARVVLRNKESLVAIRPHNGVLTMETMLFADEVVPTDSLDEMTAETKKTSKRELDMARQLIESLSGDFDPDKYRDEYRDRVLDLIERKAQGEEIVIEAAPEQPKEVPDLMAALEASIAAAKSPGGRKETEPKPKPKPKASSSNGSKKTSSKKSSGSGTRRKAAAKK